MTDILEPTIPSLAELDAQDVVATRPPGGAPRRRRRLGARGVVGVVLVAVVFALGLLAPLLAPYAPTEQLRDANLLPASASHWFGTDQVDRDVLSRVLYGIRVDVLVVFVAVPIGALLGAAAGVLAATFRPTDVLVQRVFDVLLAFPAIILAIGLNAVLGAGIVPVAVVVVAVEVPVFGRLLRSSILKVRELPFIESSEVIGARRWWVMRRHVLPNAAEPILVQLALSMSVAIFLESAMSFIGIGVRPPQPSLGNIIADSIGNLDANAMFAVGPLIVVAALVLGFQLIAQSVGAGRRS